MRWTTDFTVPEPSGAVVVVVLCVGITPRLSRHLPQTAGTVSSSRGPDGTVVQRIPEMPGEHLPREEMVDAPQAGHRIPAEQNTESDTLP